MRSAQILKECLLEEAASEVSYGLNNLPDWVILFVRGITRSLAVK
jgi:predicted trehalose synthase